MVSNPFQANSIKVRFLELIVDDVIGPHIYSQKLAEVLIAQALDEIRKRTPQIILPDTEDGCAVQVVIDACSDIGAYQLDPGSDCYAASCSWTDCTGSTRGNSPYPEEVERAVDAAATKIQAGYRGFRTRKLLKCRRKTPQYEQQVMLRKCPETALIKVQ